MDGQMHRVAYWTIFHQGEYQRIDPFPQSAVELESVGRWSHRTRVFLKGRTRFRRVAGERCFGGGQVGGMEKGNDLRAR